VPEPELVDLLERVVLAGVAITTRALNEANPGFELTFQQWRVLLILGPEANGLTVSAVSRQIGVTVPATSRQLRRLSLRGLVALERDSRDRRAARARLTAGGQATREAILAYRRRAIAAGTDQVEVHPGTLADLADVADALESLKP
jgi:DNA-binding MarR family transcriptional regulator